MRRTFEAARASIEMVRRQMRAAERPSERTLMLGAIVLGVAVSAATSYVLTQYYSVDVLTSLVAKPRDCWADSGLRIGSHCFSDYPVTETVAMSPNPWDPIWLPLGSPAYNPLRIEYPAAGLVPHLMLGTLGRWFGIPQLGLIVVLLILLLAVSAPAVWAARGARGLERIVVFLACGAAAVPAWVAIDRGNLVGLLAPIALVFLVALRRRRWGLVAIAVILAALVKPQFAILVVALFAVRQWRRGAATVGGVIATNLVTYLLWPRDFPGTVGQSIHNAVGYTASGPISGWSNVSFGNGFLFVAQRAIWHLTGRGVPEPLINPVEAIVGCAILIAVVTSIVVLGRRVDPLMAGVALLATTSLFPPLSFSYYLVFALPVAALVARDPDGPPGSGIFDGLTSFGERRRAVAICVSLAAAVSVAQIALPLSRSQFEIPTELGGTETLTVVPTTALLAPLAWLIACATIIVSYARKAAPVHVARDHECVNLPANSAAESSRASANQ
jgi:hypothetical protein